VDGDERVKPGSPSSTDEDLLVVELLQIALDGSNDPWR